MPSENWKDAKEETEKEGSDMEGWEDDGWGTLHTSSASRDQLRGSTGNTKPFQQPASGGADFFDTLSSTSNPGGSDKAATTKDPFDDMWSSFTGQQNQKSKKSEALPSASSLFDSPSKSSASPSKSSASKPVSESKQPLSNEGWDDWNEDFEVKPTTKVPYTRLWSTILLQCLLDYPNLDYPNPQLSEHPRTGLLLYSQPQYIHDVLEFNAFHLSELFSYPNPFILALGGTEEFGY